MISICVGGDSDLAQTEPADVKFGRLAKDSKKRRIYTVPDGYSQKIRQLQANATRAFQHRVILYHPLLQTLLQEAVAVAVEACADDTKGQVCYICTQALHWKTKEGLVRGCSCRGTAGFAHVSCLVEQAKILVAEAEENNLHLKDFNQRWRRWHMCSMCKQDYHGVVRCALGWACWKTYVGRPEEDWARCGAMNQLGNGLCEAQHHEDALSVREAELSIKRRLGDSEENMLAAQSNLANTYENIGRLEQATSLRQGVHSGRLKLNGEEHRETLRAAHNYALSLVALRRFQEAKQLIRKSLSVAQRALGESHQLTLKMRSLYASALCLVEGATLSDLREGVTMLEDADRVARRVLGGLNPVAAGIQKNLQAVRAALAAARKGESIRGWTHKRHL